MVGTASASRLAAERPLPPTANLYRDDWGINGPLLRARLREAHPPLAGLRRVRIPQFDLARHAVDPVLPDDGDDDVGLILVDEDGHHVGGRLLVVGDVPCVVRRGYPLAVHRAQL